MLKKLPRPIQFIVLVYLCGMVFFSFTRLILLLTQLNSAIGIPRSIIFRSFVTGISFDTVINGYILALPFVVYFALSFSKKVFPIVDKIIFGFITFFYCISFLIIAADIPWFIHQQTRLTVAALQWTDTPGMMLKIIFQDTQNYPYLLLLGALIFMFCFLLKKIRNKTLSQSERNIRMSFSTTAYIIFSLLVFIGIRGRLAIKSPIRWGSAFVSEYNLTNQLGLNPVYTFLRSWMDRSDPHNRRINLIGEQEAIQNVQHYYGINNDSKKSPVERRQAASGPGRHYNIVLVLMESMSANNMKTFGNHENLTPVIDDLFSKSLSFRNFYSDGIHTHCGIYSSLFGMPSLPGRHHMKDLQNQQPYLGLARTLEALNYQTIFFTAHDDQFDNMGGFLSSNGFQTIISQKDYDPEKILSTLGIPDHVLFEETVNHLNRLHQNKKPFFAAILTSSNHGPYEIPGNISFKPQSSDIVQQAVEYADWSIGEFLNSCETQPWFDSTIFIFTGDHGAILKNLDMYVSFHHVPLIVYAPKIIQPQVSDKLGGQIDIFPTAMGFINESFTNNSFGIDLDRETRSFISFTYDDEWGAFSDHDYCVSGRQKPRLNSIDLEAGKSTLINDEQRLDSMLTFAKSVFQTQQWMLEKHLEH